MIFFGCVLWHINHCRLFNAKYFLYVYIKYIGFGLIGFYGISTILGHLMPNPFYTYIFIWFLNIFCRLYIKQAWVHFSFTQLNGFTYLSLLQTIQFTIFCNLTKGYWMRNNQNGRWKWNGNLYKINKMQYSSAAGRR